MTSGSKVCYFVLIGLIMYQAASQQVQVGARFPQGISLGGNGTCDGAEDDGQLQFINGTVQFCMDGTWNVLTSHNVSDLNGELYDLRNRVAELESSGGGGSGGCCSDVQDNNALLSIQMCNLHGQYNLQTRECECDCESGSRGCWSTEHFCSQCATGWTGEFCTVDTLAPVITLVGGTPVTFEAGVGGYVEPGYQASDNRDGDITGNVDVDSTVAEQVPGTYEATYSVVDTFGNSASATRTVVIVDTTAPEIQLAGSSVITIEADSDGDAPSATTSDNSIGTVTLVSNFSSIDQRHVGTYSVEYVATDESGNEGFLYFTVIIEDTTPPVIVINGDNPTLHEVETSYVDAGVTVTDNADGALSPVSVVSNVNDSVIGNYTVEYSVSDAVGNTVNATRDVYVNYYNPVYSVGTPIAYYPLNEASTSESAVDEVGGIGSGTYGSHSSVGHAGPTANSRTAFRNTGGGGVRMGFSTVVNGLTELSVVLWMKAESSTRGVLLSKDNTVEVYWNNGNFQCVINNVVESTSLGSVPQGEWTHVGCTFHGGHREVRYYVGGEYAGGHRRDAASIASSGQEWGIGWRPANVYPFSGYIDEVALYGTALSDADMARFVYGARTTTFDLSHPVLSLNPVSFWTFDDDLSGVVVDHVGGVGDGYSVGGCEGHHITQCNLGGHSYWFGGGYVYAGNSKMFNGLREVSVSAWVRLQAFSKSRQTIITKDNQMEFFIASGNVFEFQINNVLHGSAPSTGFSPDTWHHVVATFDGNAGTTNYFVDGAHLATVSRSAVALADSAQSWGLGDRPTGSYGLEGQMDEVALFDSDLTLTAAQSIYAYVAPAALSAVHGGTSTSLSLSPWAFYDLEAGSTVPDLGGSLGTGTYSGAHTTGVESVCPLLGTATSFSGSCGILSMGQNNGLDGLYNVTVAAWVHPTDTTNYNMIITKDNQLEYTILSGELVLAINNVFTGTNVPVRNHVWQHVAATYDGSHGISHLYINGFLRNTISRASGTLNPSAQTWGIASRPATGHCFDGSIDYAGIWTRELSHEEVRSLV